MAERDEVARRLEAALEIADLGVEMMRARLRREHPDATEEAIDTLLGKWLRERPSAPYGDAEGAVRLGALKPRTVG